MKTRFLPFCLVALLAGCATPPGTHTVQAVRTYEKPYDQVWEDVVEFLASNNIQIKNIAKDSGVIYAERMSFKNDIADCGQPGLFQIVGRTGGFNIFVRRTKDKAQVSINTTFKETRQFQSTVMSVDCTSTGVLENQILAAIK